jgi:hypothetical protein
MINLSIIITLSGPFVFDHSTFVFTFQLDSTFFITIDSFASVFTFFLVRIVYFLKFYMR